jgi:diguanylate cyclase (GGDEF)-like protein
VQRPRDPAGADRDLRILLIEGDDARPQGLRDLLRAGLPAATVTAYRTLGDALPAIEDGPDVVLADLGVPDASGPHVVSAVHARRPGLPVLVLTGRDDPEGARAALRAGAVDHLAAGTFDARSLCAAVLRAVERAQLVSRVALQAAFAQSLLDATDAPTCAVDRDGTVLAVNAAWQLLCSDPADDGHTCGPGLAYAAMCEGARGQDRDLTAAVAAGLRAVLAGTLPRFEYDYASTAPGDGRWFSAHVTPLRGGVGALVTHVDITGLKQAERALSHQALHDALTGLPNQALLGDRLTQALSATAREGGHVGVAFIDLDRFQRVNDALGHAAGDLLLCAVAARLTRQVRLGDTLARFSGDEFVVVWHRLDDPADAERLGLRLAAAFEAPFEVDGLPVTLSASVGVAAGRAPESADELLLAADAARYDAKSRGRGRVRVFTPELRAGATTRLRTEAALGEALEQGQLVLHYQPVVDLTARRVVGAEALVRWQHPEDGLLLPGTFLPTAETSGLIVPMGEWVLGETCRQAMAWEAAGRPLDVAVNLSIRQVSHPDVVEAVRRALLRSGLPPRRLLLEVTESAVAEDAEAAGRALAELAALGVRVAIDDFGTGHSSLLYLKRHPIRVLKADQAFVSGLGINSDDDAIVASVVSLARAVGAVCIAEGVETLAQYTRLVALGCAFAQGYLFSGPVAAEQLPAAIETAEAALVGHADVPPQPGRRRSGRPVSVDREVGERIARMHSAGASLHTIAAALNAQGAPHPQGLRWHAAWLARLIAAEPTFTASGWSARD